jgi:hypothetical protein
MGKACIYIKKLSDINKEALVSLIKESISYLQTRYRKEISKHKTTLLNENNT